MQWAVVRLADIHTGGLADLMMPAARANGRLMIMAETEILARGSMRITGVGSGGLSRNFIQHSDRDPSKTDIAGKLPLSDNRFPPHADNQKPFPP